MPTLTFMIGIPGSGKSHQAKAYAKLKGATIVSTDEIRGELFGDENCQDRPDLVFDLAYTRIAEALNLGKDVVFDAMNISYKSRATAVKGIADNLAKYGMNWHLHVEPHAIVMDTDLNTCLKRNRQRDRHVPEDKIVRLYNNAGWTRLGSTCLKTLEREGFKECKIIKTYLTDLTKKDQIPQIVDQKYKNLIMGALYEAFSNHLLGSEGDKQAQELYSRLKYEDYCKRVGKQYEDLTDEDFETIAMLEAAEEELDLEQG